MSLLIYPSLIEWPLFIIKKKRIVRGGKSGECKAVSVNYKLDNRIALFIPLAKAILKTCSLQLHRGTEMVLLLTTSFSSSHCHPRLFQWPVLCPLSFNDRLTSEQAQIECHEELSFGVRDLFLFQCQVLGVERMGDGGDLPNNCQEKSAEIFPRPSPERKNK